MTHRKHKSADQRVIARILGLSHGIPNPSESFMSKISETFVNNEGSWSGFFEGDPEQVKKLKVVIKKVVKHEQEKRD